MKKINEETRIAHTLGIHQLGADSSQPLPHREMIDRELKKRIWAFLCIQDWLLIPFGNSYAISPRHSDTPLPLNSDEFSGLPARADEGDLNSATHVGYNLIMYKGTWNLVLGWALSSNLSCRSCRNMSRFSWQNNKLECIRKGKRRLTARSILPCLILRRGSESRTEKCATISSTQHSSEHELPTVHILGRGEHLQFRYLIRQVPTKCEPTMLTTYSDPDDPPKTFSEKLERQVVHIYEGWIHNMIIIQDYLLTEADHLHRICTDYIGRVLCLFQRWVERYVDNSCPHGTVREALEHTRQRNSTNSDSIKTRTTKITSSLVTDSSDVERWRGK